LKRTLKISQITRKRISVFLLLDFIVSTFLVALPQSRCNGMCSLEQKTHQCSEMVEMTCCDMMDMNDNSFACGMEVTENSCDFELNTIDTFTFVIPKTVDSKIILTEISSINFDVDQNISNEFILSQNVIPDVSPPIYITVSSFLI
jgi:hypothetical protein